MLRSMMRYGAGIVWLGAAGAGLAGLWRYSVTPAEVVENQRVWPEGSALSRSGNPFSLVMFLHPECPCSRASVEELGVLLSRNPEQISAQVLFFTPEDKQAVWSDTTLCRQARAIPGVGVQTDADGREAGLFAAGASGETFVYDPRGVLVFHGGITAARGHSGDNDGLDLIGKRVSHGGPGLRNSAGPEEPARSPVYGCSLQGAIPEAPVKREQPKG
ncbi:MAG: hypothetical protein V4726_16490 [Verrucomicrobiota bacterium]